VSPSAQEAMAKVREDLGDADAEGSKKAAKKDKVCLFLMLTRCLFADPRKHPECVPEVDRYRTTRKTV
jgi:hypothetical protein